MPMELILKSVSVDLPQEIENLEQLKSDLIPRLKKYNDLVVTEESIKAAKDDKAALNKLKKAIEEQRISIKKQYLEPYNILEAQCKEVVALIDAPIQAIDKQIKAFDEIEKSAKLAALTEEFTALNAPDWLNINDVLNHKWENKTQKLDSLKAEMAECCKKHIQELDKLMEMYKDFPYKLAIEKKYKDCKDFSQTAVYAIGLQQEYKKDQERKAQEEDLKEQMLKAAEEAKQAESVQNASEQPEGAGNNEYTPSEQTAATSNPEKPQAATAPPIITGRFEVSGTAEQIKSLGNFMRTNGIHFSIIKD